VSSRDRTAGRRLTLITPEISPHRIPIFNAIADRLGADFHVVFLTEREPRRRWPVYESEIRFSYEVLGGVVLLAGRREQFPIYLTKPVVGTLLRRRPRHVLVGGWHHFECYWALAVARLTGARFSIWSETPYRDGQARARDRIKRMLIASSDGFLVPGPEAAQNLVALGADPARIVEAPNAVDVDFFAAAPERPREHLLIVSRLVPVKGVDVALRALARIEAPPLLIAGDGPARRALEVIAHTLGVDATFVGHVDREELRDLYAGAEALIFPTLYDPWGLVVNEALAAGCPVVATSAAGCARSLIEPGVNGEIVPPGDVDALRSAVEEVLDPKRAPAMRALAADTGARHRPERCAEGFVRLVDL
jgi:glycosyltransferase involved in cell wall biosynthesis